MKRLRNWLNELTLTQQLISIVILSVGFFLTFVFFNLNLKIDSFVRSQMENMLDHTQKLVIYNYRLTGDDEAIRMMNDSNISHFIYDVKEHRLLQSQDFPIQPQTADELLGGYLKAQEEPSAYYDLPGVSENFLGEITKIDEDHYLISVFSNAYRATLKAALADQIVNATFLVVSILFCALLLWTAYLIRELGQLKNYAQKVKRGEEATLKVDRKDEIGELATSLVEMNDELQRQQKIKEELIQNISHDLKTPIATIKSYAESIKDGIYPYDSLEKSVDVIIEHSERLEKKVQNLLLLNRVGYLVANDETGSTDLKDVIDKVLLSLKVMRPEIEIVTDVTSSVFYGDEEPWRVVIENLLDNALRYAKTTITLRLTEKDFSIENDGPFMSNDRIEKLFKPYEKGTDGKFGLGLSIVHKIVTVYDCEVYAYNTHDGVAFKITKRYEDKKEKKKRNRKKNKD